MIDTISYIINFLGQYPIGLPYMFKEPITVKKSPHTYPVKIEGIKTINGHIAIMEDSEWFFIEEYPTKEKEMIINTIIQRLKVSSIA